MKRLSVLALLPLLVVVLTPTPAFPCGGMFCSGLNPVPVEQNSERILFVVNPDSTVSAHVEIKYAGAPEAFSWIVPVPDTPTVDVVPPSTLRLLDMATVPQIIPPPTQCTDPLFGGGVPLRAMADAGGVNEGGGGVTVEELPTVGVYEPEVIAAADATVLVDWLRNNDYLVTDAMVPFIGAYIADGFKFLGMKLTAGANVADIQPIKMTYPGGEPCVPIRLTAVGAEPDMGILVFISAPERYGPTNYRNVTVPTDLVQFDPIRRQSNYHALVSSLIDSDANGRGFVTEYATESDTVRGDLQNLFLFNPPDDYDDAVAYLSANALAPRFFTRLYTRLSAEEMTEDPLFGTMESAPVSRTHDLSDRPAIEVCSKQLPDPIPCGDTYCGPGAECAQVDDGVDGCVCPEGQAVRAITAPDLIAGTLPTVHCQATDRDLLAGSLDLTCPSDACGGGTCSMVGGFPVCTCEAGMAGTLDEAGRVTCRKAIRTFGVGQLSLWSAAGCGGCDGAGGGPGLLAGLLVLGLSLRRRRR